MRVTGKHSASKQALRIGRRVDGEQNGLEVGVRSQGSATRALPKLQAGSSGAARSGESAKCIQPSALSWRPLNGLLPCTASRRALAVSLGAHLLPRDRALQRLEAMKWPKGLTSVVTAGEESRSVMQGRSRLGPARTVPHLPRCLDRPARSRSTRQSSRVRASLAATDQDLKDAAVARASGLNARASV